jgi:hypothetical protein
MLQGVPVFGNFPVLNSVEIVIRRDAIAEAPGRVDVGEWLFVTRLDARQEFDDLLLLRARHKVFFTKWLL